MPFGEVDNYDIDLFSIFDQIKKNTVRICTCTGNVEGAHALVGGVRVHTTTKAANHRHTISDFSYPIIR